MPEGPCPPSPLPMFLMKHEYRSQKLNYPNLLVELLMLTNINPCVHGPSWIGLWNIFQPNPAFLGGEITNATHSSFQNHQLYHIGIIMELCWVVDLGHSLKIWVIIQLFTPIIKEREMIYTQYFYNKL